MLPPPRTFESLTSNMQEKIYSLLVEKYTLQGKENPSKRAWQKIRERKLLRTKAWQRINFFSMQAIDKCLVAKGLPERHFPKQICNRLRVLSEAQYKYQLRTKYFIKVFVGKDRKQVYPSCCPFSRAS